MSYFSIVYHQGARKFQYYQVPAPFCLSLLPLADLSFPKFHFCSKTKLGGTTQPPTHCLEISLADHQVHEVYIFIFQITAINNIAKRSANTQGSVSSYFQEHFLDSTLSLSPWASHRPVDVYCQGLWVSFDFFTCTHLNIFAASSHFLGVPLLYCQNPQWLSIAA